MQSIEIQILKTNNTIEKKQVTRENLLSALQSEVDGYVERIPPRCLNQAYQNAYCHEYAVFANENGLIWKLQQNPYIQDLVGNVVLVKIEDWDKLK